MKKLLAVFALLFATVVHAQAQDFHAAENDFNKTCAVCHGDGIAGGDSPMRAADAISIPIR
jgi:mono/diheme cytochrome c family protein